jgi:hypothetical protein
MSLRAFSSGCGEGVVRLDLQETRRLLDYPSGWISISSGEWKSLSLPDGDGLINGVWDRTTTETTELSDDMAIDRSVLEDSNDAGGFAISKATALTEVWQSIQYLRMVEYRRAHCSTHPLAGPLSLFPHSPD